MKCHHYPLIQSLILQSVDFFTKREQHVLFKKRQKKHGVFEKLKGKQEKLKNRE